MIVVALARRLLPLALVILLGWAFVTDAGGLRTWIKDVVVGQLSDSVSDLNG